MKMSKEEINQISIKDLYNLIGNMRDSNKESFEYLHNMVKSLDNSMDNKIKDVVYEKLDIKWQSFAVMIALMLAFSAIHATALYYVIGK